MGPTSRRNLLGGALAMPFVWPGRAGAQANGPLRIGLLAPISGSAGITGRAALVGAQLAVAQLNREGGILGRPVELIYRDDKASPNDAIAAARELSGNGVTLMTGGCFTAPALAVLGILPQLDSVFIVHALADSITHENYTPRMFRFSDNNYMRCLAQAKLCTQKYPDVLEWGAFIGDNETARQGWRAFSSGLRRFYPAVTGKTPRIAEPVYAKFGATDFKNQIYGLLGSPVQGIFMSAITGDSFGTMLQQAKPLGLFNRLKVTMDLGQELSAAKSVKRNLPPNFWSGSTWYYGAYEKLPATQILLTDFRAATGETIPDSYVGQVHGAVMCMAQAAIAAKSTATGAVAEALETGTFQTVKGDISYRKRDHQSRGDVNMIELAAQEAEPGWTVTEAINIPSESIMDEPTPGKPIEYG